MPSASPLERACIAGIDRIETAMEGVRAKIPCSAWFRAKHDEIFAQAKISPARMGVSWNIRGIFDLTPSFPALENSSPIGFATLGSLGTDQVSRIFSLSPRYLPTPALSPSERAKHLKASSIAAEGRTKRILAAFWEERRSGMTFPDPGTFRSNRRASVY